MQRETQGRSRTDFFGMGDPFGNFRGFGMIPSLFGGRDPFDDPFFTRPFGSMFESSRFETPSSATDCSMRGKAVVIEELTSDDEGEEENMDEKTQKNAGSSKEPSIEHPDDDPDDGKRINVNHRNDYNRAERTESQVCTFSFQTCKVTYGGVDGAYYTSTRTRRTGGDGVVIEESKEADKTTGQANRRISRGIHDKGHSVTRKLNADGKVDTLQTLHNLNEDELAGFEEAWNGNVKGQLHGWSDQFDIHGTTGSGSGEQKGLATWGGWRLPYIEHGRIAGGRGSDGEATPNASGERTKKVVRINID